MASQTPTEIARDAKQQVDILRTEFVILRQELEKLELVKLHQQVAVLQNQVEKLERAKDEAEKRHWQFIYIVAGGMTTLLVTLLVQLVLALLKKP